MHKLSAYGIDMKVVETNDCSDIGVSRLVIIAAGFGKKPDQTRLDFMNSNAGMIKGVEGHRVWLRMH